MIQKLRMQILYNDLPEILGRLLNSPSQELMKSVCSQGHLPLLFVIKVMVWCFLSNSHKVMMAPIVMSTSNCCSGDIYLLFSYCSSLPCHFAPPHIWVGWGFFLLFRSKFAHWLHLQLIVYSKVMTPVIPQEKVSHWHKDLPQQGQVSGLEYRTCGRREA
jgi:hypothetical protein